VKTRSATLIEKYSIYTAIVVVVIIGLFGVKMIYSSYSSKISESRKKKNEIKSKELIQKQELDGVQREINENKKKLDQKQKAMGTEKLKFEAKKKEFNKYVEYIPPFYMKSLLRKEMLNKAMFFNIDVLRYSAMKINEQRFIELSFFPLQFSMELTGEYGAIKRFLWYLDHDIFIRDIKKSNIKWKFITDIPLKGGISLEDPSPNTINKNVPSGPVAANKKIYNNPSGTQTPVELQLDQFIHKNSGFLKDNKLHIKLKITTYFRKAKNG